MTAKPAPALKPADVKPATPLPWRNERSDQGELCIYHQWDNAGTRQRISTMENVDGQQNAAYIVHACNAYPQLVADREEMREYLRSIIRNSPALPDANPAEMFAFKEGRALLVRLGGDK